MLSLLFVSTTWVWNVQPFCELKFLHMGASLLSLSGFPIFGPFTLPLLGNLLPGATGLSRG